MREVGRSQTIAPAALFPFQGGQISIDGPDFQGVQSTCPWVYSQEACAVQYKPE